MVEGAVFEIIALSKHSDKMVGMSQSGNTITFDGAMGNTANNPTGKRFDAKAELPNSSTSKYNEFKSYKRVTDLFKAGGGNIKQMAHYLRDAGTPDNLRYIIHQKGNVTLTSVKNQLKKPDVMLSLIEEMSNSGATMAEMKKRFGIDPNENFPHNTALRDHVISQSNLPFWEIFKVVQI